jgi:hypothetical protein
MRCVFRNGNVMYDVNMLTNTNGQKNAMILPSS